jgi:hypothetical protein
MGRGSIYNRFSSATKPFVAKMSQKIRARVARVARVHARDTATAYYDLKYGAMRTDALGRGAYKRRRWKIASAR